MACSSSCIPRCAVELLFVEDLMNRVMRRHGQFKAWTAAPYREFIFNAFSDEIGEAVDFIDRMLEWEVDDTFSRMVDEHRVDREAFIHYALHFEDLLFKQGFDPDNFLDFCVRLVSMAVYFAQYGKPMALELAWFFIMKVLTSYDLFEGGWDTLNAVAKKYVERKEDFCRILTPDVSDDESSMNASEDDVEEDEYYLLNEDGGFAVNDEEKPKEESDSRKLDFSGLDLSDSYENEAEGCFSNVYDESSITEMEKPRDDSDRERMDLSGSKLDLPATSGNEAEGCISNVYDESFLTQGEKPQDEPDRERVDLSGSQLDLPATFENVAEGYISDGSDKSSITETEKPQDKPDRERMNLTGSKLDLPACSESKGKIKSGIPSDK